MLTGGWGVFICVFQIFRFFLNTIILLVCYVLRKVTQISGSNLIYLFAAFLQARNLKECELKRGWKEEEYLSTSKSTQSIGAPNLVAGACYLTTTFVASGLGFFLPTGSVPAFLNAVVVGSVSNV